MKSRTNLKSAFSYPFIFNFDEIYEKMRITKAMRLTLYWIFRRSFLLSHILTSVPVVNL